MSPGAPFELFDTHCHINTRDLRDDIDAVWARARAAGVVGAVVIGIDIENSIDGLAFTARWPGLYPAVGIHPCHAHEARAGDFERLAKLACDPRVVAIGESGLDLFHDRTTLAVQIEALHAQAELAIQRDLPLVLHVREAFPALREALRPFEGRGLRAILHCFGGTPADLDPWLDWGFYVSFAGVITYKKADNVRDAARRVPQDRLLIETDAPWLPPLPHRGQRNEPAYLALTARGLAEAIGSSLEEVARLTTANARRCYRLLP